MWAATAHQSFVPRQVPCSQHGHRHWPSRTQFVSPVTKGVSVTSDSWKREEEESTAEVGIHTALQNMESVPQLEVEASEVLRFDKLQIPESDSDVAFKREFGKFIAREALLDEEYWTAAWLRAESNWEDQPCSRYVDSYKKKFAEQEFAALKRRCSGQLAEQCKCIVAVKKEMKDVKQTVLKSIVGTLDFSIRRLLQGETFPGEKWKSPGNFNIYQTGRPRYGYIANLCVAKYARRRGIASNMVHLAVDVARSCGVEQVFIHVHRDNRSAQKLYEKMGFETVVTKMQHQDSDTEWNFLLCLRT